MIPWLTKSTEKSTSYATKSSSGEVTIDITPKGIIGNNAVFSIAFNTHSVDLSPYDLKKIMTLTIDGQEYKPIGAPALSGHHVSGEITFAIDTLPESFEIIIIGIPDVEERIFTW